MKILTRFSNTIVSNLVCSKIITKEEKNLYIYGINQSLVILINMLTYIFIGFFFRMILEDILFLIAYIPLRSYASGYHAKTQLRCYLLSSILIISSLLVIRYSVLNDLCGSIPLVISSVIIATISPVPDPNNPLNKKEKSIYRKYSRIILSILILIWFFCVIIKWKIVSSCIIAALSVLSVVLIVGLIKNEFYNSPTDSN